MRGNIIQILFCIFHLLVILICPLKPVSEPVKRYIQTLLDIEIKHNENKIKYSYIIFY